MITVINYYYLTKLTKNLVIDYFQPSLRKTLGLDWRTSTATFLDLSWLSQPTFLAAKNRWLQRNRRKGPDVATHWAVHRSSRLLNPSSRSLRMENFPFRLDSMLNEVSWNLEKSFLIFYLVCLLQSYLFELVKSR